MTAKVEVGRFEHEGVTYKALGSVIDEDNGILIGYPVKGELTTWDGRPIAPLEVTGHARAFGGSRLTCYRVMYNGRRYSGRGPGEGMLLRLRRRV